MQCGCLAYCSCVRVYFMRAVDEPVCRQTRKYLTVVVENKEEVRVRKGARRARNCTSLSPREYHLFKIYCVWKLYWKLQIPDVMTLKRKTQSHEPKIFIYLVIIASNTFIIFLWPLLLLYWRMNIHFNCLILISFSRNIILVKCVVKRKTQSDEPNIFNNKIFICLVYLINLCILRQLLLL